MRQQILYSDFVGRLFGCLVDLAAIMILTYKLIEYIGFYLMSYCLQPILTERNIEVSNIIEFKELLSAEHMLNPIDMGLVSNCYMVFLAIQILIAILMIFVFWRVFNSSPGMFILRLKLVDEKTLHKPTTKQLIIRAFMLLFSFIGFFFIPFNKRKRALHDIASGTLVIKK